MEMAAFFAASLYLRWRFGTIFMRPSTNQGDKHIRNIKSSKDENSCSKKMRDIYKGSQQYSQRIYASMYVGLSPLDMELNMV